MTLALRADPTVVTESIRKSWNGWNHQERSKWMGAHGFNPFTRANIQEFDDLHPDFQDALFCEFLDLAQKELE